jgi:hypothetical protein
MKEMGGMKAGGKRRKKQELELFFTALFKLMNYIAITKAL